MGYRRSTQRERIEIVRQHEQGESLNRIALRMGFNRYTVRYWWRRYREGGLAALQSTLTVSPRPGILSHFHPLVKYVLLRLKREHPHWGPDVLLYVLRQRVSLRGLTLPSRTSVSVYLRPYLWRFRQHRVYTQRRPTTAHWQPRAVHEQWQMDFKAAEEVGSCGKVVPFLVTEGLTSAPLTAAIHSGEVKSGGLTFRDIQADLRQTFARWGLPDAIRMDRGTNFIGSNKLDWPGTLLLWLVGLGVHPLVNHPYRPTQNARVERQGRTWKDDVAVGARFKSLAAVQVASDEARHARLAHLPTRNRACAGLPPLQAHPELLQPRRPYSLDDESRLFDYERVELYLSDWLWIRTVDKTGKIWIADQYVSLGRIYHNQAVAVRYDLSWRCFVVSTQDGKDTQIALFEANSIAPDYILGETSTHPRRVPWVVVNQVAHRRPP